MGELMEMSNKEVERYHVLKEVMDKRLKQRQAAVLLKIGERQVRNLLNRIKAYGAKGLISGHRGKRSNRRKSDRFRQKILALLREKYEDFGPTLAQEKLEEWDGIRVSVEALRLWMIEAGLWISRKKKGKYHRPRRRRECFGELIQADGSHHRWFGEDLPEVDLNVFIDDATGKITSLYFSEEETLSSYFSALRIHLEKYGRPRSLYTDRYAVFQSHKEGGTTQLQRALKRLEIELILANSPQAKGRVERVNRTLQDRLLKELRHRGIRNISDANAFAKEFIQMFNQKFSQKPMSDFNAHRSLEGYDLERLLCRYETRTLLSGPIFQYNRCFYKVQDVTGVRQMKGRKVEVRLLEGGKMRVFLNDKELKVTPLDQVVETPPVLSRKQTLHWNPRKWRPQPSSHPWKSYGQRVSRKKLTQMGKL